MQPATPIDRKFITWHVIYTLLLAVWSANLRSNSHELGPEAHYWVIGLGVVPSLLMLILGLTKPMAAYRAAMLHGGVIVLISVVLTATAYGFLWVVVFFPLFGFVLEASYIYWRWNALRGQPGHNRTNL